jgi:hypothetical protein
MPPLGRAKHKISDKPGKGIKKQIGMRARGRYWRAGKRKLEDG